MVRLLPESPRFATTSEREVWERLRDSLGPDEEAVEAAFDERYGESVSSSTVRGGHDALGHAHGRRAADAARFGSAAIAT